MQIGNGQFLLGDCFDLMRSIPDGQVDMVLCDLPYGTTQNKWDSVLPFEQLWKEYWRVCKPNAAVVLTATQPFSSALVMSCPDHFGYEWVWHKSKVTGVLNAKRQPLRQHELVLVFYRKPHLYNPQGTQAISKRRPTGRRSNGSSSDNYGVIVATADNAYEQTTTGWPRSVLQVASESKGLHPTQKPVPLFEYLIKTYTNPGDLVLDNCAGSGTTAVAAERTGRRWICMEKQPEYYYPAVGRLWKECQK